jgi:phosphatidylglycerol---prolipoprotein diacylglyceryl transferase
VGLPIRGYGALLLLAVAAAVGLAAWRARRLGMDPEIIFSMALWLFVAGIAGARLFYVIEYWESEFHRETWGATLRAVANFTSGGLVVYGSMLGGGAALAVFIYRNRLPGWAVADLIAPSVALGMAIGRLGCFMNGCCYGGACDLPWAVRFPPPSPPYVDQLRTGVLPVFGLRIEDDATGGVEIAAVEAGSAAAAAGLHAGQRIESIGRVNVETARDARGLLTELAFRGQSASLGVAGQAAPALLAASPLAGRSQPIHPTQLYSAIDAGLLCLVLLAYYPYRRRDGEVFALLLTLHPISRFLIEIIRTDEPAVLGTAWSISQNLSLSFLLAAAGVWWYLSRQPRELALPPRGTTSWSLPAG